MSNVLRLRSVLPISGLTNGVGLLDSTVNYTRPMQFNPPEGHKINLQVCSVTISDRIPNVFNASPHYQFDNRLLRVHTDNPGSTMDITLTRGLYSTAEQIGDAINQAIIDAHPTWFDDVNDPAISIDTNFVTDTIVITLDSTKLGPGHNTITLDISKATTNTDIADTLGFSQATAVMTSVAGRKSIFASNQTPKMDTQGTQCDVHCSIVSKSRFNDRDTDVLASIPFAGKNSSSDNIWPAGGQLSPVMVYDGSHMINDVKFYVQTVDERPMLFMSGQLYIVIAFSY